MAPYIQDASARTHTHKHTHIAGRLSLRLIRRSASYSHPRAFPSSLCPERGAERRPTLPRTISLQLHPRSSPARPRAAPAGPCPSPCKAVVSSSCWCLLWSRLITRVWFPALCSRLPPQSESACRRVRGGRCTLLFKLMRLKLDLDPADGMYADPLALQRVWPCHHGPVASNVYEIVKHQGDRLRYHPVTSSNGASVRPPLPRLCAWTPSVGTSTYGAGLTSLAGRIRLPAVSTRLSVKERTLMTSTVAMPSLPPSTSMPGAMKSTPSTTPPTTRGR